MPLRFPLPYCIFVASLSAVKWLVNLTNKANFTFKQPNRPSTDANKSNVYPQVQMQFQLPNGDDSAVGRDDGIRSVGMVADLRHYAESSLPGG